MNLVKEMNIYEKGYALGKVKNLKLIKSNPISSLKDENIRAEFEIINEINHTCTKCICLTNEYEKLKDKIVENETLFIKFKKFEEKQFDLDKEIITSRIYDFVKDAMIITDEVMKILL